MRILKRILAVGLVALSVMAVALPAMAAYSTMYVDGGVGAGQTVRLRSSASDANNNNVLANVPYASQVQAEKYDTKWHRVNWNGYSGFMLSSYLSTTNPNAAGWTARYGAGTMNSDNGTSTQVRNLQTDINATGIYCDVDGYYGPNTTAAVKKFQDRYSDLVSDGLAGPLTKEKLFNATH